MTRVTRGYIARRRRRKNRSSVSGFRGAHSRHTRTINQQKIRALVSSHQDRGRKKRDFRRLWITRLNAVIRKNKILIHNLKYNEFINNLYKKKIILNRKMLLKIAIFDSFHFDTIVFTATFLEYIGRLARFREYYQKKTQIKDNTINTMGQE